MSEHSPDDLALTRDLTALCAATAPLEPPPSVDAAIERAIRSRTRAIARRRTLQRFAVPLAFAASLATVAVIVRELPSTATTPVDATPPSTPAAVQASARGEAGGTAFVPLVSLAELERTRDTLVVALDMPRSSLTQFGVAVTPARATESVPTELLIRPDGAVLAIRFVP